MLHSISRLVKKLLVFAKLDALVANKYHYSKSPLLRRLIPDRRFYTGTDVRNVIRDNVKFRVRPSDLSQWFIFADNNDFHVQAAMKTVDPQIESLILDVGANCGQFSLVFAEKIRRNKWNKRIIAFEPNPSIFSRISENLALNPPLTQLIELKQMGIGEFEAEIELQMPLRNSGAGSLVRNYENEPHEKFKVPINSIDNLFADSETKIEFVKIDVENFEFFVIKGGQETINKYRPAIYIEVGKGQLHQDEIFRILKNSGYSFYKEDNGNFSLIEIDTDRYTPIESLQNFLAVYEQKNELTKSV